VNNSAKNVGLVLGGGGARGMAHLGVLKSMEERGYRADAIAGCSVGGIVGALIANGMCARDIIGAFEDLNELELLDIGAGGGIIGGKGIARKLEQFLPSTFEQLSLPLKVTAVDLQVGELVVLGSGPLIPALLATSALPGILSPVSHMERKFLDGGLLNNLPVDVIRTMTHSPVIAVDVAAPPNRRLDFEKKPGVVERLKKITRREFRTLTIELFMKSFDIPAALVTNMRLSMSPPDVLIRPSLETNFGVEDFHRVHEGVDEGYRAAEQQFEGVIL
jgi:NTE family protein